MGVGEGEIGGVVDSMGTLESLAVNGERAKAGEDGNG